MDESVKDVQASMATLRHSAPPKKSPSGKKSWPTPKAADSNSTSSPEHLHLRCSRQRRDHKQPQKRGNKSILPQSRGASCRDLSRPRRTRRTAGENFASSRTIRKANGCGKHTVRESSTTQRIIPSGTSPSSTAGTTRRRASRRQLQRAPRPTECRLDMSYKYSAAHMVFHAQAYIDLHHARRRPRRAGHRTTRRPGSSETGRFLLPPLG